MPNCGKLIDNNKYLLVRGYYKRQLDQNITNLYFTRSNDNFIEIICSKMQLVHFQLKKKNRKLTSSNVANIEENISPRPRNFRDDGSRKECYLVSDCDDDEFRG